MHTKPLALPEIEPSELKAVRDFLAAGRDPAAPPLHESRPAPHAPKGGAVLRNGIARARSRGKSAPSE